MKIKVDHSKLDKYASNIENSKRAIQGKMTAAQVGVILMSKGWSGKDAALFKSKWQKNYDKDSAYSQTLKQMEAYANFLRYAAKKYKSAQTDAVNRASKLK